MITLLTGDLLNFNSDFIVQQVNCKGVMGAGLAKQIREKYPRVYATYMNLCDKYQPEQLLGKCFCTDKVISVFGQLNYGRNPMVVYTKYTALHKAFTHINKVLPKNKSIAFPYMFGCGLANGAWETVYSLIEQCFPEREVYIVKLDKCLHEIT